MLTSTLSIMDEKPNLESYYRKLCILATAALAVHVLWRHEGPGDSLASWLSSTMPTILTGIILFAFLLFAANENSETTFFSLTETFVLSSGAQKVSRESSNPAREDRHVFHVSVIAFTAGLGVSVDLVHLWYTLCQAVWGDFAKEEPNMLIFLVTIFTGSLSFLLFLTWVPMWGLLQTQQQFGGQVYVDGSEDCDTGERKKFEVAGSGAMPETLVGAMEFYEKDLRSQRKPSQSEKKVISKFLEVLLEWHTLER